MYFINLIISIIITIFAIYFSTKNFIKNKGSLKTFIIFSLIVLPILTLINIYFEASIRIILNILMVTMALYFSLLYKNIIDSLYYAIVYEVLAFIFEIILSVIFVSISTLNLKNNFNELMLLFSLFNSLCVYLVSKIKIVQKTVLNLNNTFKNKKSEIVYIAVILFIMIAIMVININNFKKGTTFYINAIIIIFIFTTLIYMIHRDFENEKLENKYKEMMEYLCRYEKIINDQGKKNHEYNNQLMVIKGYMNNPKKLEEYLSLIIEEHKCGQNYTIRQLSYFPNGGIKGLIYDKLSKMEENKIKNYLYIDKKAKDIFEDKFDIKTYQDITKLLGIFLDNAIDATLQAKNKEIELEIKNDVDCSIITISNTYDESIDIKQIGKKGFSTKGSGHGYGLSIVKDISRCNKNIETFNDIDNKKFKQTIIAYYCK